MSLREEARGAYRRAILTAAERVFGRAGFYATRMSDIAQEAGVGVGTLYNYFASKDVILSQILAALHEEFMQTLQAAPRSADPIERIRGFIQTTMGTLDEHGALFASFLERGALGEHDVERLVGQNAARDYERFLSVLTEAVQEARQSGGLRRDLEPRLLVAALSGSINGAMYAWLQAGRSGRLSEVGSDLFDLFLRGARPT